MTHPRLLQITSDNYLANNGNTYKLNHSRKSINQYLHAFVQENNCHHLIWQSAFRLSSSFGKKRIEIPTIEAVINERYGEEFLTERTGYTFSNIIPTIENAFHRITLVNEAKTERLTIDFGIRFINFILTMR